MKVKICLVDNCSFACTVYTDLKHLRDYCLFTPLHCLLPIL